MAVNVVVVLWQGYIWLPGVRLAHDTDDGIAPVAATVALGVLAALFA